MSGVLIAPTSRSKSPSLLADWIEVLALLRSDGLASDQDLIHLLGIELGSDEPDGMELLPTDMDLDIAEPASESTLGLVADEVYQRSVAVGLAYPFEVALLPRRLKIARRPDWESNSGAAVYVFCLLISAFRHNLISSRTLPIQLDPTVGGLFQICACLAAGGYLNGQVAWIGWPRPERDQFLPALSRIFERFGFGRAQVNVPSGFPESVKDAGVDVIAWIDHSDGRPSKVVLLGQCASGVSDDKSISPKIQPFLNWFDQRPFTHVLPALFVPYPMYLNLEDANGVRDRNGMNKFYFQKR